jgi:hypothetical protein
MGPGSFDQPVAIHSPGRFVADMRQPPIESQEGLTRSEIKSEKIELPSSDPDCRTSCAYRRQASLRGHRLRIPAVCRQDAANGHSALPAAQRYSRQ